MAGLSLFRLPACRFPFPFIHVHGRIFKNSIQHFLKFLPFSNGESFDYFKEEAKRV
jgi:hypothetical protein